MTSSRAEGVAEVLWELKRAGKVATFSTIARRAGFSAGTNGRSMHTALRTVRRDWPHLQWWRAIQDNGQLERDSEHVDKLKESGYDIEDASGKNDDLTVSSLDEHLMLWEEEAAESDGEPESEE
jgi:alkylated DNA nucleotide flippase Atl1